MHYHVNVFINGCLNDSTSGPYETLEEARAGLDWELGFQEGDWFPAGQDRYTSGRYIIAIETCNEPIENCTDS